MSRRRRALERPGVVSWPFLALLPFLVALANVPRLPQGIKIVHGYPQHDECGKRARRVNDESFYCPWCDLTVTESASHDISSSTPEEP
jgi:hypothetical protein